MSATIIDHALKSSMRIARVIIARYREDCPRSERPLISSGRTGRAWAPWGPKSVRLSVDWMFKSKAKSTCNFSSTDMFLSKEKIYLRRHRANANLIFNVSLMSDQTFASWKPSAWFPYNFQEKTSCVYFTYPPKFIQIEWVHPGQFCF